jgi:hypothetical protein
MPNKHNDERHHHISKMKFRVTNWLRAVFRLAMRQTEGLIDGTFAIA